VLDLLARVFVGPGDEVIFSEYAFLVYPLVSRAVGGVAVVTPAMDWGHDLEAMSEAVSDRTRLIFIANPNNPTGTYVSGSDLEKFLGDVPDHVVVVIDEAYFEYVTADDYPQTRELLAEHPNLVILRTFSKIHSLAGLRVGYGIGHPGLIGELHKTREPFNVNMLSQAAAIACLDNWHEVSGRRDRNRAQLDWVINELEALGLETVPSQTNFVLVRGQVNAGQLTADLLQKGVIVRPMHAFGLGDGAMRISIGLPEENQRCITALKEILT
jgi:histidinol-phosphate aminotransferase